jgi:hypothetical protein
MKTTLFLIIYYWKLLIIHDHYDFEVTYCTLRVPPIITGWNISMSLDQ